MPVAFALQHALGRQQADAHRVHERVRGVRLVEHRLAADVRDAGAVAVVADPGDRAAEVPVGRAEAEPVEQRDRPRAHRDDVAEDPADAGRGALERLDRGRMVVRLDLERDRDPVAEVDHAGVLARALEHALALRRQPPQQPRRVLVAAVLRPEHGEDGELEVVRRAPEQLLDARELPVGETERAVEGLRAARDGGQAASLTAVSDGSAGRVAVPRGAPASRRRTRDGSQRPGAERDAAEDQREPAERGRAEALAEEDRRRRRARSAARGR